MNLAGYESILDFMQEIAPHHYQSDYFKYLALISVNRDFTFTPIHITFQLQFAGDLQHIYGFKYKGKYYSTEVTDGYTNLLEFISLHVPHGKVNVQTLLIQTLKGNNEWNSLVYFMESVYSNTLFFGLGLLIEYYGRLGDPRYLPQTMFGLQDVNIRYENLELVCKERYYAICYPYGVSRRHITDFLNLLHIFIIRVFPQALGSPEFSLKFPINYGVGKHWVILVFRKELVEFYASGPFTSQYTQPAVIDLPTLELMAKRMQDIDNVYLDTNPTTLTMVI